MGTDEILSNRLANAGLSRATFDAILGGEQRAHDSLPGWVATFRSSFVDGDARADGRSDRAIDANAPLPFEELMVGAVRHAREAAATRTPNVGAVLAPQAAASLERTLLAHLTFVASRVLGLEFYEFRFCENPLAAFETQFCRQRPTRHIYDAFVAKMWQGGLLEVFDRYPVLARLLTQAVDQWVLAVGQLCDRYVADHDDLAELLDADLQDPYGSIVGARADLSDRHSGGRTVISLSLRGGYRLVYKPRGAAGERAWAEVLRWLNSRDLPWTLTAADVLDRGSHHWSTWVPVEACASEEDVERFYFRCGLTLAALHVLAGTDIHFDNVIASADEPVVVDLEMLLNPGADDVAALARVGMLPDWRTAPDGHRFDTSALGADSDQDPRIAIPAWEHVNTDQMRCVTGSAKGPEMDHRVRLDDSWPSALEYLDSLLDGFTAGYRGFLERRDELRREPRIHAALAGAELRVILRDTTTYARLLLHLLQPRFLRDGLDRSIELEWLARPLSVAVPSPAARVSIYDIERRAAEMQDIPLITSPVWEAITAGSQDEDLVALGAGRTPEIFYERLATLSEADLRERLTAIEQAVRHRFDAGAALEQLAVDA